MHVPAFCDTCGAVFRSGIVVDEPTQAIQGSFAGKEPAPCPVCRSAGRIRDDVFALIDNLLHVLSAPERTADETLRLVEILSDASARKDGPDQVVQRICADVPGLSGIADLVPKAKAELNSFISMTVALSTLLAAKAPDAAGARNVTIEQALAHVFNETKIAAQSLEPVLRPQARRNAPCPCGSGKRFKHCCGRLSAAAGAQVR